MRQRYSSRITQKRSTSFLRLSSSVFTFLLLAASFGIYGCSQEQPLEPTSQSNISIGQQVDDPNVIPGQYIVVLKTTNDIGKKHNGLFKRVKQDITKSALIAGVVPEKVYSSVIHGYSAQLTEGQYQLLMNDPSVDYIEPDRPVHMIAQTVPWGITAVNAPTAHARGTKGSGVKVGIIDTGIDHGHPDLAANYVSGIDYVNGDNDPMDDNGHGSHVSGTVGAIDNSIGVIGVAPSVSLYGIKVLDAAGSGTFSNVVAGIDWAAANGMDVVNMSLGASIGTNALQTACDNAYASGVVICAAAGNDYGGPVGFPAKYSSTIAVSAVDQGNNLANFSNKGPEVEVTAPGVGIVSTYKNGQYASLDGTSMATPHVAGVVALIWSTGQFTSASAVRNQLTSTATDIGATGRDNNFGWGLVDADAATNVGPPVNQAPTANANGPYSALVGNNISFSSAGSSDPDGTITGYSWDFGDGGTSTAANPAYAYSAAGSYNVSLTVTDDQSATGSNSTTATITVPNTNPPTADFSGNPTTGDAPLAVSFSDLSTNGPTSWSWNFGDGATSSAQNPSHTYANSGSYDVSMTATNANGSNTMTKVGYITANTPPPPPPSGEGFILSRNADLSTDDRTFDVSETMYMKMWSDQVDFTNMSRERWEMRDSNGDRIRVDFTNNGDGTWTAAFALSGLPTNLVDWTWKGEIKDNNGTRYKPSVAVTVTQGGGGNQAPSANANGPYSATLGNAVAFSSAGSSDPDGTIVGYSWDFGDGGTSSAANPNYTYSATGTYTVSLTVTDDQGATGSASTSADITGGGGGGGDVVTITKAQYDGGKQKLDIRATTDDPNAILSVVGYGQMTFKASKNRWELKITGVNSPPATVTVTSTSGGSDTSNVTIK